jgi:hypothetical protein
MDLNRRDVFRIVLSAGVAAASVAVAPASGGSGKESTRGKRRAQYQPDSPEVLTFYRVNRYPMK